VGRQLSPICRLPLHYKRVFAAAFEENASRCCTATPPPSAVIRAMFPDLIPAGSISKVHWEHPSVGLRSFPPERCSMHLALLVLCCIAR
jgi:hypothetical protein